MRLALALSLLSFPALAQSGVRESDSLMNAAELEGLLSGQIIEFFDGSKSRYSTDGLYGYTYTDDGPVWQGTYIFQEDSQVCVAFDNGSARCDVFVRDGGRITLITADGTRFPIRNITVE